MVDRNQRATASQLCEEFGEINKYLEPFGFEYNCSLRSQNDDPFAQVAKTFHRLVKNFCLEKTTAVTFRQMQKEFDNDVLTKAIDAKLVDCACEPLALFRNVVCEIHGIQ